MEKPVDVSDDCWADFLAHRKVKKALVTDRVIKTIRKEAMRAGMTLEQALDKCVAMNWQGFNADWVTPVKPAKKEDLIFGNVIELGDAHVRRISSR